TAPRESGYGGDDTRVAARPVLTDLPLFRLFRFLVLPHQREQRSPYQIGRRFGGCQLPPYGVHGTRDRGPDTRTVQQRRQCPDRTVPRERDPLGQSERVMLAGSEHGIIENP